MKKKGIEQEIYSYIIKNRKLTRYIACSDETAGYRIPVPFSAKSLTISVCNTKDTIKGYSWSFEYSFREETQRSVAYAQYLFEDRQIIDSFLRYCNKHFEKEKKS